MRNFASLLSLVVAQVVYAHPGHEEDGRIEVAQNAPRPQANAPGAAVEMQPRVSIAVEGEFRVIRSNGLPDHAPGQFPRRGNPNAIAPQEYTFRVPLKPVPAAAPVQRGGWWWGVAINGVPFEPGTAETWRNEPGSGWRYEAATGFLNLGLDEHNAHVQPNGSYHYHAIPTGLIERLGGDGKKMLLIGWAADGYPVYSGWAHENPKDAASPVRKMKSSYQLRKGERTPEPQGPGGKFDGRFTEDWEFVKESGDLDALNGREGVTPEFPEGTYYYCVSADFPFVARMWRGEPDPSFGKGGRGPGLRRPQPGGPPRGILEEPQGAPGRRPMGPLLRALDANGDGTLDGSEIESAAKSLRTLDHDGDGALRGEELAPRPEMLPGFPGEPPPPERPRQPEPLQQNRPFPPRESGR